MRIDSESNTEKCKYTDSSGINNYIAYIHAPFNPDMLCMQDQVHIRAKLRVRLVKSSILLPLSDYVISSTHLEILMEQISKDKHLLNEKDLSLKDKMNHDSVNKMSDLKVRKLLQENVPSSEGIVVYLEITNLFMTAFSSEEISPLDRVYNAWIMDMYIHSEMVETLAE